MLGQLPVLLLGSDVMSGYTDVIFAVQIHNGITRVIQVPRDTYVETAGQGLMKANGLYGVLGPAAAKQEMSQLIGIPVQQHLKVHLDATAKVTDALGGVEVNVPKRMYYVDNSQGLIIDLYPSPLLLKGSELVGSDGTAAAGDQPGVPQAGPARQPGQAERSPRQDDF